MFFLLRDQSVISNFWTLRLHIISSILFHKVSRPSALRNSQTRNAGGMWGHGGAHGHPLSFPLGPLMFLSLSCASCQLPPCLLRLCETSGWVRVEHSPNEGRIDNFLLEIYHWRFPRAPISSVQFPRPATAAQAKAPVSTSALWTQYFPADKKQEAPAVDIGSSDTGCAVTDPGQKRWCFHKTALSSRIAPTQHRHMTVTRGKLVTLPLYLLPVKSWLSFLDYTPIYIIQLYIIYK